MQSFKDFCEDSLEDHFTSYLGVFSLFLALIAFLGFKVNENFIIYPLTAIGIIAIIIAFLVFGFAGIIAIPVLGLPIAFGARVVLSLMELFPMVTVGAFVLIGVVLILIDIFGNE